MQDQEMIPSTDLAVYEKKVLEKVNPFRTKLNELRELHKEAPDLSTTKGKEEMRKQIAAFRSLKTESEAARKFDKAAINRIANVIEDNYGQVWNDAEKEQKDRDAKLKEQLAEEQHARDEKEAALVKVLNERAAILSTLGADFVYDSFVINGHGVKLITIKRAEEEVWQNVILKGFKEQADIIEQERLADEKRKQEEAEKLRQELERLRKEQEEFKKQQAELKRQQEEFKAKQREAEQQQRLEEEKRKREIQQANQLKIESRAEQLLGRIIFAQDGWYYSGYLVITLKDILEFSDHDFNNLRDIHNKRVAEDQEAEAAEKEAEEKRLALIAIKSTKEAMRKELLKKMEITDTPDYDFKEMPDEEWNKLYADLQESYNKKKHEEWLEMERVKKIQEEEREKERQAEMTDNEKWREWKLSLQKFTSEMPDFKSPRYRRLKAMSLEKFSEIHLFKTDKISSN